MRVIEEDEWNRMSTDDRDAAEKGTLFHHHGLFGVEAARFLVTQLEAGEVDGIAYIDDDTECGCILGTLAKTPGQEVSPDPIEETENFINWVEAVVHADDEVTTLDSSRTGLSIAETLAFRISRGNTPENNWTCRAIRDWTNEWIEQQAVPA